MKTAVIEDFRGSWGSGIAQLVVREGRRLKSIPCENAPTVRALASLYPDVIGPGHTVNVAALKGKRIKYVMDNIGLLLGGLAEA